MPFILALLILFSTSASLANLCSDFTSTSNSFKICQAYLENDTFPSHLTRDKIQACDDQFVENTSLLKSCYKVSSRIENVSSDNIRTCAKQFYFSWTIQSCLKFAARLSLDDIRDCDESTRTPLGAITCFNNKSYPTPQAYLDLIED